MMGMGRLLTLLLLSGILFGCLACFSVAVPGWLMLQEVRVENPEDYAELFDHVFGELSLERIAFPSTGSLEYEVELTSGEKSLAQNLNLELTAVARATAVEAWMNEKYGESLGDRSIYLALTGGESAHGRNCGQCTAWEEYAKNRALSATSQRAALRKLAAIWKNYDIRARNPLAAQYIPEDYNPEGIIGSCGGGALGISQFIPTTALIHLDGAGEPFDLWAPDTAMQVMALELHRIGWRRGLSVVQQTRVLLSWNQHRSFANKISATARQYASYLKTRGKVNFDQPRGLRKVLKAAHPQSLKVKVLALLKLLPEVEVVSTREVATFAQGEYIVVGVWRIPVDNPTVLSDDAQGHASRANTSPTFLAWDLTKPLGSPVYAAREGTVIYAGCTNAGGYGCWTNLRHEDGYETVYAHMIQGSIPVRAGDQVDQDTVLGRIGWTGVTSFGPHIHFEIRLNRQKIDPAKVLGKPEEIGIPFKKYASSGEIDNLWSESLIVTTQEKRIEDPSKMDRIIRVQGEGPLPFDLDEIDRYLDDEGIAESISVQVTWMDSQAIIGVCSLPVYGCTPISGFLGYDPQMIQIWLNTNSPSWKNLGVAHELRRNVNDRQGKHSIAASQATDENGVLPGDYAVAEKYRFVR